MISVVIPAFNAARHIAEALAGIDSQGIDDLEILVVDDHSNDETAAIARRHPKVRLFELTDRTGPAAARNRGILESKGSLVALLDADDYWEPQKLKIQMKRLQQQADLIAISGRTRVFTETGEPLPLLPYENEEHDIAMMLVGTLLVRRELFDRIGLFDESLKVEDDTDFFMRLLESKEGFLVLRDRVLNYRQHETNLTRGMDLGRETLPKVFVRQVRRIRANSEIKVRHWSHLDELYSPLISVVVPAYNAGRYLARAIESILAQSLQAHEVIVVDDGSTDDTVAVAQSFGDRVKVIAQPNQGAPAARNRGLEEASGNQIAFLDSDDAWLPTKLESQWRVMSAAPFPDLIFGAIEQFNDHSGSFIGRQPGMHVSCMLARRSAFERIGYFRTDVDTGDFIDWFAKAKEIGLQTQIIDEVVAKRNQRQDGLMGSKPERTRDYLKVLKESLDRRRKQS